METSAQIYMLFISGCLLLFKPFKELFASNYVKLLLLFLVCSWLIPIVAGSIDQRFHPLLSVTNNIIFFLFLPVSYTSIHKQFYKIETKKAYFLYLFPLLIACVLCIFIFSIKRILFSFQSIPLWYSLLLYITVGIHLYFITLILKKHYYSSFKRAKFISDILSYLGLRGLFRSKRRRAKPGHHPSFNMSHGRVSEIEEIVRKHLEEKKPFLQLGYSLRGFSDEIHVPLHVLSAFINTYYKMNFNDFINEYRVLYSIDKLLKKEWKYKKLETIAEESGFNNRNTFTSAFKKVTGVNPSEFLRDIKLGKLHQTISLVQQTNGEMKPDIADTSPV
jgi:AraC-like DNA-binding protein